MTHHNQKKQAFAFGGAKVVVNNVAMKCPGIKPEHAIYYVTIQEEGKNS
jgi:hypothetical protein